MLPASSLILVTVQYTERFHKIQHKLAAVTELDSLMRMLMSMWRTHKAGRDTRMGHQQSHVSDILITAHSTLGKQYIATRVFNPTIMIDLYDKLLPISLRSVL